MVSACYPPNAGHSSDAHACDAVVHVNAGQTVWVQHYDSGNVGYLGTAFSGFLVSPDP